MSNKTRLPRSKPHHRKQHCPGPQRRKWLCTAALYCYGSRFCLGVLILISPAFLIAVRFNATGSAPVSRSLLRSPPSDKATVLVHNDTSVREKSAQREQGQEEHFEKVISPFTSVPPEAIDLDIANNNNNNPRHSCISKMRQRHDDALRSYLQTPPPDHILLVDPAYHSNVGDHMITLGELQFLQPYLAQQSNNTTIGLSQCSYIQAGDYVPPCDVEIPRLAQLYDRPVAIWHGGGNWGDLWRRAQEPRIASLRSLLSHGYTVLTMPNSWYYKDKLLEQQDIEQIRHNVEVGQGAHRDAAGRLVFCWREEFSYQQGATLLPFATNVLVPDIAFQLGPYSPIRPSSSQMVDIVLLLRDDHESVVEQRSRADIRSKLNGTPIGQAVTFSIVDWNDRLVRFDSEDFFFTPTAIQLLSMGRVVICDRLHAAILAYLMGVPFVYLDQISGKITKTLSASMSTCDVGGHMASHMDSANNLSEALMKAVNWLPQLDAPELSRAAKREQFLQRGSKSVG
jgi:exopolysaccharide biosynthesis predicted pyruvyltransferase EpsI